MTISDVFNEQLVLALHSGMSYKEFWEEDPEIFWAYRFFYFKKQELENEKINYTAWLNGLYVYSAVSVSLSNAFKSKGSLGDNYLEQPINLFGAKKEDEEKIKRENKIAQELKIKNRALQIEKILNNKK